MVCLGLALGLFLLLWVPVVVRLSIESNADFAEAKWSVRWGPYYHRSPTWFQADPYKQLLEAVGEINLGRLPRRTEPVWQPVAKILRGRTRCRRLEFHLKLGTGDPFWTALAYGAVSAALGTALAMLSHWVRLDLRQTRLQVVPLFNETRFEGQAHCILSLPLGYFILAILRFTRFRRRKGAGRGGGTPN